MSRSNRLGRVHRDPVVRKIAAILDSGSPSKFAFEGACRAGLRAARCLSGKTWKEADDWADLVIRLALHRIGATRPTWAEAQPDAEFDLVERVFCASCGGLLEPGDGKYCSETCRNIKASEARSRKIEAEMHVLADAFAAARSKGDKITRQCEECGKPFELEKHYVIQKFCSVDCHNAAQVAAGRIRRSRTCESCGKSFVALHRHNRFCSHECAMDAKRLPEKTCERCGVVFRPRTRASRFCCKPCMYAARREPAET